MKFNVVLVLRVLQLCLSILILGLSAYVVNWYTMTARAQSPSEVNFLVAAPVISVASICYIELTLRLFTRFHNKFIAIFLDIANTLMYFSGFIAMAVFLNGLSFCHGTVCGAARAGTAFAALNWVTWMGTAVIVGMDVFRDMRLPLVRKPGVNPAVMTEKETVTRAA